MKKATILLTFVLFLAINSYAQDLSQGLMVNDLSLHPMEMIDKPGYLNTIIDPSFGTTIRRITDVGPGGVIVPMYSTIQAWNADETRMILYNQSTGYHELLDGMTYQPIRTLTDVDPQDIEQIFWDFNDPDIFYYPEYSSNNFVKYSISTQNKQVLADLEALSGCSGYLSMGNDIQMIARDADVFTFRCDNTITYAYRISTGVLTTFDISEIYYTAPAVAPSGNLFYHENSVYNSAGNPITNLNESNVEHACIGQLANGNDAYFAISFAEGPQGGCLGDIIAHDLTTGACFPVISQEQGYDYSQSGTHISALAHKNTEGGWIAASMMGYDLDGQALLDQELVVAKAEEGNIKVCRIGHHRSDEDQYDYWGEPHAVISPTGTRVLFGSDWSGAEDGQSIDCYVVELPAFTGAVPTVEQNRKPNTCHVTPNPMTEQAVITFDNPTNKELTIQVFNAAGKVLLTEKTTNKQYELQAAALHVGVYFFRITDFEGVEMRGKLIKK